MNPIIILACRSRQSYLLINHLAARFDVAAVVFEESQQKKLLRHRLRKFGPLPVGAQLAFICYDRLVIKPRSRVRIDELLAGWDVRPPDGRLKVLEVDSVNGQEVAALLRDARPSAVMVSGTGIIATRILDLAPAFVNIHVGITPRYRGVHGGFWAIYEGNPELVGTTIHLIDAGVDTGGILAQVAVPVDPFTDTYRTLPVKQYLGALDAMADAVRAVTIGQPRPYQRSDIGSRQWYTPTPLQYVRFLRMMRALRRRAGSRDDMPAPGVSGSPRSSAATSRP
ncbi:formyl transferase [Streptosporangium minutum]|uniref:formyl transferase n=1 Tax=Streptosporangium minutum TaxID=569862 RepID=UPI0013FDE4C7|nr:formyl transferase [Streptosporangium minutum]